MTSIEYRSYRNGRKPFGRKLAQLWTWWVDRRQRAKDRRVIAGLSDHILRDVGLEDQIESDLNRSV